MNVSHRSFYVMNVLQMCVDCLTARILYFLNDYRLTCLAAQNRWAVDALNGGPQQYVAGANWLLREPIELRPPQPIAESEPELPGEAGRGKQSIRWPSI